MDSWEMSKSPASHIAHGFNDYLTPARIKLPPYFGRENGEKPAYGKNFPLAR